MHKVQVILEDDLNELHKLLEVIESFGIDHNISRKDVYYIHLACEEVFVNFVTHDVTAKDKKMTIFFCLEANNLTIVTHDNGHFLNPLLIPEPDLESDLETRTAGGFGIFLVRQWADNLEYSYENEVNTLTMKKRIHFSGK